MLARLRGGLRALLRRREVEADLDAELRAFLDCATEANLERGMSREEASRAARAEFGSVEAVKDYVRDAGWERLVDGVAADLRFAVRGIRRNPGFSAVMILTLALGIGANTALFTIVDAVLFKPLPVRNPNELALMVWDSQDQRLRWARGYDGSATSDDSLTGNTEGTSFPYLTYERLRTATDTFASVFAFAPIEQLNVIADGDAEVASGQYVTGDYYTGLGVQAYRGRLLTTMDDEPDAAPAAVITWRYWQRRFNAASDAVGKVVTINGVRFTIVGVSPPQFSGVLEFGEGADVTIPVRTDVLIQPTNLSMGKPSLWWLRMMARLQPGVSRRQAQSRVDSIYQQSVVDAWKADPESARGAAAAGAPTVYPHLLLTDGAHGDEFSRRRYRRPLGLLMGVVALVLLIACINVANLLLARNSARQQEFATRTALGAGRWRIARQLLVEALVLAAIAGVAGTVVAVWTKELLLQWSAWIRGGASLDAGIDARVLGFTILISTLTGLLFGLVPAIRVGAVSLTSGARGSVAATDASRMRFGRLLIVVQVAASLVLLVSGALFTRTLRNLHMVETGFDSANVLLFRVKPQATGYTDATVGPLYDRLIERLNTIPGVTGVALSRHPLLSFSHRVGTLWLKAGDAHNGDRIEINVVSPSFFDTMAIRPVMGRKLLQSDTQTAPPVVVVNEAFARAYFAGATAVGQQFLLGRGGEGTGNPNRPENMQRPAGALLEVVGVVADTKYTDLRTRVKPTVYQSYQQSPSLQANFEVRYAGTIAAPAAAVRAAVQQVDARLPVFDLRTQAEQSELSVGEERMFANLSIVMGVVALALASIGLYGIMSYSVRRRTAEIGVRMALGAGRRDVVRMVLGDALTIVIVGLAVGIPLAVAMAKAASATLDDLLYGVQPTDPVSFALAVATLLGVAACAAYLPAIRAARTDPMVALRCE